MSDRVFKLGVLKLGCIGAAPLLDLLLDERADRDDLETRAVTSGAKLDPAACTGPSANHHRRSRLRVWPGVADIQTASACAEAKLGRSKQYRPLQQHAHGRALLELSVTRRSARLAGCTATLQSELPLELFPVPLRRVSGAMAKPADQTAEPKCSGLGRPWRTSNRFARPCPPTELAILIYSHSIVPGGFDVMS